MQNTLEDVDRLVASLKALVCVALDPEATFRFEICVSEALTNSVKHAQPKVLDGRIDVILTEHDETLVVEIFDPPDAEPFDPRDHAADLQNMDPLAEEGRGLGLIMQCADAVDYGLSGDRNRLVLQFAKATNQNTTMQSGEQK